MAEMKLKSGFSAATKGQYSNLLDLKEFFTGAEDYVILKLSDEFPNYRDYSDIDILCRDRKHFLNHVLAAGVKYEQRGFRIETVQDDESLHVDFFAPGAEKLNFRFDLLDKLAYKKFTIDPRYTDIVLGSREQITRNGVNIYVPSLQHDLAIRFCEYIEWYDTRPEKIKHKEYVCAHYHPGFVDVVNENTDLNISVEQTDCKVNFSVRSKKQEHGRSRTENGPERQKFYCPSPTCQIPDLDFFYELQFGRRTNGCFVEIGAYDGEYASNTSALADMGWTGCYVEPVPEYAQSCKARHARNKNVTVSQVAIGAEPAIVDVHVGGALSTISEQARHNFESLDWAKGCFNQNKKITVEQVKLDDYLIQQGIKPNFEILVVDVEGYEWNVFRGFDIEKWRPQMIIVELHDQNDEYLFLREDCKKLVKYFAEHKYKEIYKDSTNTIYVLDARPADKERIDYFLIWGNGLQYTNDIVKIIRSIEDFEIISIVKKNTGDVEKFVQDIYACDTVPFEHLVAKTRYLLKTPPEIVFILVRNKNAQEKYFGEGPFRHIQCQLIKNVKEEIRNRFNPRINGKRTEEHVIHASDYESQVRHVLKILDLPPLEYYTRRPNRDLDAPFHIEPFDDYSVREIDIDNLYANILGKGVVPLTQTPHYKYLTGDKAAYQDYHEQYFGKQLTEDHFPEAFDLMLSNFKYDYKTEDGRRGIILAKTLGDNKYQIFDGVHRAAILKRRGDQTVTIAEPVYGVKQHTNRRNAQKCDVTGLIFSKDRAMQLQAAIESFLLHCRDHDDVYLTVLYKASREMFAGQYAELKNMFPGVNFIEEGSFKEQVLSVIDKCDYILFLVDDNIFTRHFCVGDITAALSRQTDAIGFSLRLGENTTYCYMKQAIQRPPRFEKVTDNILKYDWTTAEHDYNYPLEVSSSIYRSKEIAGFLSDMDFANPNTLEAQMVSAEQFKQTRPKLLCFSTSVAFCNPVNKVQNVYEQNRSGTNEKYSSECLAQIYQQGMVVDAGKYSGFTGNGVHQEVNFYFKKAGSNTIGISVIIPCYNQANFLPEAVESVVNQTYKNWECIIVNDCGTDNTVEVAKQLIEKYPEHKIRLVSKPQNTGLADTRNTGISAAVNEWILPLDSDDMFEPTFMRKAADIIQQEQKTDIVYAGLQEFGASTGKWMPVYSRLRLMLENTMPYASLFSKDLWRKVGGYDNLLSVIVQPEDWNFWLGCLKYNPVVRRINEALFLYRVNPQSMYHKTIKGNLKLAWAFIVTCHPDLYPVTSIVLAWQKIANCPDGAYEKILKAVEKYPDCGLAHLWRGLKKAGMGRLREALEDYRTAAERAEKGDWQASFALMTLLKSRGDFAGARRSLDNLLSIRPDFDWAKDLFSPRAGRQKVLFYYDVIGNPGETSPAGTVTAVLNFAEMLGKNCDMEIHITGDLVGYPEQYGSLRIVPLPTKDKREEFLAYYDVVFFATHVRFFKGLLKPPGQIWILWQHCWNADDRVSLSYMSEFDIAGCLSELHGASLRKKGIGDEKLFILPNLIDTSIYSPKAVDRNNHSIMYAGALHEHKCVQVLIEAFRLVRWRFNDAELHIYGDGLMWRGGSDYGDNLRRTKPQGAYFHGYVTNKDMPEIYSKHGILCLPSKYETFPMVILESQACGCIPIAHNAGGTAATLSDGQTGLLYSPNTPENLARTIIAAFGTIDADPSIRHRAVNFIRENFSADKAPEYISKLWERIDAAREVNSIRTLLENNNTALADLKCRQLSVKYPNHPEVLLLQALIMDRQANTHEADAQIAKLLEKYPNYVGALNDYGLIAMKAGDTKKARELFTKAYKFNPWDRNTITNCYKILKKSGNYEQAKRLLLNYLTTIGVDSRILYLLGEIDAIMANGGSAVNLVSQQPVDNNRRARRPARKDEPLVSIIMPVYNGAGYIGKAIESVLGQDYASFELVIVDDGSTDNTKQVVLRYNDGRISYVYKKNGGVASARNLGLQKARGEFIVMLDSDDMLTTDYIARHLQEFDKHPQADMVYCDDLLINEQDRPIRVINRPQYTDLKAFISDMFRCGFPVVHFKTCIKRSVFDKIGLYDQRLIVAEDYDMMRRFAKHGLKMVHLPEALYLRRIPSAGSLSRNTSPEKAKSHFDVVGRFTETFTPEQLFPEIQWNKMTNSQKIVMSKYRSALVYLGIANQYLKTSVADYASEAFDRACAELDDCCKAAPGCRQFENLRKKCRLVQANAK